jgi:hypothetical protein
MKTFDRTIVLIPCWGRRDVVKFCKESLTRLGGRRLWVLSESDPYYEELRRLVSGRGNYVVEYRNQPLGMKLNAGIAYMMRYMRGWDYLMNWGSDDIADVAGLQALYKPFVEAQNPYFGINSCYVYDSVTGDVVFCRNYNNGVPVGAGRMIHRRVLDDIHKLGHHLYANQARSGLDNNSHRRMEAMVKVETTVIDSGIHPYVVDIKSGTNINIFDRFRSFPLAKREIVTDIHTQLHKI